MDDDIPGEQKTFVVLLCLLDLCTLSRISHTSCTTTALSSLWSSIQCRHIGEQEEINDVKHRDYMALLRIENDLLLHFDNLT